jgi:hypothetical protein
MKALRMRAKQNRRACAAATFGVTILLGSAGVEAFQSRHSAARCWSTWEYPDTMFISQGTYAGMRNDEIVAQRVFCPVDDSDEFRKESITTLNLHGYDGSSSANVNAMVCVSYWVAAGGECSTPGSNSAGTGNYTLQPSRAVWNAANRFNFGYIVVTLPAELTPTDSTLRGFFTAG